MNRVIFSDGVINIGLNNGMVRIEFGSLSISEKDEVGNPKVFSKEQLVMTPQVFLKTFSNMESMLHKLVESGIVKENHEDEKRSGPARDSGANIDGKDKRGGDRRKKRSAKK
jgi:hypothetical protein